ncbi:helix-turn-helix transcriptional regulator [Halogeometricum limi]|uniref:IclR helix-turn-helix domain-containing protein n=1 Tax=Halogeometricum limi TaxID=555875 RepID=A0A1I6FWW0_9EURY|nr:hypothetical protein [Halogeometricum limi]SFR34452.1 hypothetical protein SAMN04488124_0462 [Halogeometricum limi]
MRIAALTVALLLVFSGAVPVVASASTATAESDAPHAVGPDSAAVAQTAAQFEDQPRTVLRVRLRDSGDAVWRVEMRYALDTPNETAAFERIGREYANGDSDVGVDAGLFRRIANRTSEATGREMEVRNASYGYSVDEGSSTGTLTVEFVWTNFLEERGDGNLALGDAFRLPSGESEEPRSWLSLLSSDQRLVVQTPPGYATDTTSIEVLQRNNSIIVDGPGTFEGEDGLVVTYRKTSTEPAGVPWDLVVGGGIVVALLVLVAAVVFRWQSGGGSGTKAGGPGSATDAGDAAMNGGVAKQSGDAPTAANEDAGGADGDATASPTDAGGDADGDEGEGEEEVDLSLLSDEERVEHLLEREGGRMKQANIVKETGWSDAKVSQLLSAMADEGRVEKLRLGRENLISLPDEADEE